MFNHDITFLFPEGGGKEGATAAVGLEIKWRSELIALLVHKGVYRSPKRREGGGTSIFFYPPSPNVFQALSRASNSTPPMLVENLINPS